MTLRELQAKLPPGVRMRHKHWKDSAAEVYFPPNWFMTDTTPGEFNQRQWQNCNPSDLRLTYWPGMPEPEQWPTNFNEWAIGGVGRFNSPEDARRAWLNAKLKELLAEPSGEQPFDAAARIVELEAIVNRLEKERADDEEAWTKKRNELQREVNRLEKERNELLRAAEARANADEGKCLYSIDTDEGYHKWFVVSNIDFIAPHMKKGSWLTRWYDARELTIV